MTNKISYKLHLRHRPFFNLIIHYISKKGKKLISAFILKDIFLRINKKVKKKSDESKTTPSNIIYEFLNF